MIFDFGTAIVLFSHLDWNFRNQRVAAARWARCKTRAGYLGESPTTVNQKAPDVQPVRAGPPARGKYGGIHRLLFSHFREDVRINLEINFLFTLSF